MDVRELITKLLEYDMDANVEVRIETDEEDDEFEFGFEESSWGSNRYVHLVAKPKDYVLVNKSDFEDVQKQIDELESKLEELESQ